LISALEQSYFVRYPRKLDETIRFSCDSNDLPTRL
jgi:hypothetical protein